MQASRTSVQAETDPQCDDAARQFITSVRGVQLISSGRLQRDRFAQSQWMPQLRSAFERIAAQSPAAQLAPAGELKGLPVVEVPAQGTGDSLALLISGDGGWAGIDKELASALASHGTPVVGLDSLRYFWKARTPQGTADDVDRILRHYLAAWHRRQALLIGYSQGADVMPFVVNRLPSQTREHVTLVALLGPGKEAVFQFHLRNWLSGGSEGLPVLPELESITALPVLCLHGEDDAETVCPAAPANNVRVVSLPGGHHFGGHYDRIVQLILEHP